MIEWFRGTKTLQKLLWLAASFFLTVSAQAASRTVWANWSGLTSTAGQTTASANFNFGTVTGTVNVSVSATCEGRHVASPILNSISAQDGSTNYPSTWFSPTPPMGVLWISEGERTLVVSSTNNPPTVTVPAGCTPTASTVLGTRSVAFNLPISTNAFAVHWLNMDNLTQTISTAMDGTGATAAPAITRNSGNPQFTVSGTGNTTINNPPNYAANVGCSTGSGASAGNPNGACGTTTFVTPATTLGSFAVQLTNRWSGTKAGQDGKTPALALNTGDVYAYTFSLIQPSLVIRKRSVGGTGSFSFNVTSSNLDPGAWTSNILTTTVVNTYVSSPNLYIQNVAQSTTLSETVPAGWTANGTCYNLSSPATAIATIAANGSVTLPAALDPTQSYQCDFTDTQAPLPVNVSIVKSDNIGGSSATPTQGKYIPGGAAQYTLLITNGGPGLVTSAPVADVLPKGATITAAGWSCAGTSGGATCSAPNGGANVAGDGTTNVLTGLTVNLPANSSATIIIPVTFASSATSY